MSTALSVVIISRGRPDWLARCLAALTQQDHPQMEVVLVADAAGLAVRPDLGLKRLGVADANVAVARNLGLAQAAGAVVAFIDDDAAAEPGWASALAGAFADARVIAATGPTRGPDGIRWQARAERVTPDGIAPLDDDSARLWFPDAGGALSTLGTNCAFRRDALAAAGGFDPAFAYHLDESDVNLRLAAAFPQGAAAFVPDAVVWHAAASGTARAGGAPADLCAIGRSEALFARRFGAAPGWQDRLRARQRARLIRAMLAGRLDPFRLGAVMASLEAGLTEGARLPDDSPAALLIPASPPLMVLPTRPRPHLALSGWHWQARSLRARADAAVRQGYVVSLMLWTPSFLPHREGFTPGGWWERRGGVWGAGAPDDAALVPARRRDRWIGLRAAWARLRHRSGGDSL